MYYFWYFVFLIYQKSLFRLQDLDISRCQATGKCKLCPINTEDEVLQIRDEVKTSTSTERQRSTTENGSPYGWMPNKDQIREFYSLIDPNSPKNAEESDVWFRVFSFSTSGVFLVLLAMLILLYRAYRRMQEKPGELAKSNESLPSDESSSPNVTPNLCTKRINYLRIS